LLGINRSAALQMGSTNVTIIPRSWGSDPNGLTPYLRWVQVW
jgi:hypothetical protein